MNQIKQDYKQTKVGIIPEDWEVVQLGDIALKSNSKNTQNLFNTVLSNSATNGIVLQNDYFDRDIANKDNLNGYYISEMGSFIYNPIIIDFEREFCIFVSLGFLRVNEDINNIFIKYWMSSDIFEKQIESQVSGSSQKNLNVGWLKNFKIKLPSLPEQQKIAEVLSLSDHEINLLKNELKELKLQKKALMQKLLTGKVRVGV